MPDLILLQALLPETPLQGSVETESTNTDARNWLKAGAEHGSLVIADRQRGGRGRMGRSFASEAGGLYMSLVLKTDLPAGTVTTLCAVAVRRAVRQLTGRTLAIKWVNDLQESGKKVCGILCEGVWSGSELLGVIAGIGLNVSQKTFSPELREIAASLYPDGSSPKSREAFAAAVHREIMTLLKSAPAHMAEYRKACITLGKRVQWQRDGRIFSGIARAVDDTGALCIDTESGPVLLAAGEVSLKSLTPSADA